ncbi:hypothetical protein ISF_07761 [Cordyceps fumosorosea ARSEF 2679]|uniref:Nuclear pore protein n=1 Tax=Cordyceps fumosorosea (strain ARSEF 2679) TaxID=1081104 RepID=A0A167NKM4_CORFA|nr:hypothetical protein ISF_07761 [Cordyceps fumosorosea ARSEF 2679]OAA55656.1 hypothetical protein ISF_07761 [Cordyceps fumosorosea ARSEF 2679]
MTTTSDSVTIDPRGDIRLQVGRDDVDHADNESSSWQHAEFLVCSRALARASPIFDRMLYGPYAEAAHASPDWSVALPEDKPAPMQVLLQIAHARFSRVPPVLSVDNLHDLAVLTNYYDATALLAPWIGGWMAELAEISHDANVIQSKLLWIAWEFGLRDDFGSVAHRMLTEEPPQPAADASPAAADQVQAPHIIGNDNPPPPYFLTQSSESISSIRLRAIQQLLDIVADVVSRLTGTDDHAPRWCRHAARVDHRQCELMILGSLSFCLARAGIWPLPTAAAHVRLSLGELHRVLTNLVIHDIGAEPGDPRLDHETCNPAPLLMQRVRHVMLSIPSPVTEFHVSHLERRARKLRHGSAR